MTKKKRTVSKRYNKGTKKKNRTSKKRKQRTSKKGGAGAASQFRRYNIPETVTKDKIVLEFDFDQYASDLDGEDLKSKFTNYLDQNLLISVNYQNVDIQLSDDKRKALVTIPKSEWMRDKRSYNDYKKYIQEKLDEISKIRTPGIQSFATIEDTSVGITKVQINEKWIQVGEERIQRDIKREQQARIEREERKKENKKKAREASERRKQKEEERIRRTMEENEARKKRELEARIRAGEERKEQRRIRREEERRQQEEKERLAATTVQRFARGIEARTKANEKRLERETAAETIQRFERERIGRKVARERGQQEAAARKIQSVQRGIVGRAEAVEREESKRIFWTNENGDITKGTEGIVGDYKEIVRDSLDKVGIPILLKKGDGVRVRVLNFPTNTDPWKYGIVTGTDPLKVNVQGEGIEEWPIVRKDASIETYIEELKNILTDIESGDERISVINERIDRSKLLLGQEVDCSYGEGDETKCNLNKDCRFVTYDFSEDLQQGSCLREEEIIEKIKPLLEEKIRLKEEEPFQQENYERLIEIYEQLNRLLKNTDYAPQIESLRKEIKKKQIDMKRDEYREESEYLKRSIREERDIDRIQRLEKSFQKQRDKDIQTKKRFEGFIEDKKVKLKSRFTKDPKTIPQLFENGGFDLKELYLKYLKKYPKTNDKDRLIEHYNNFIEQYYDIVLNYDKQIIERGKKD